MGLTIKCFDKNTYQSFYDWNLFRIHISHAVINYINCNDNIKSDNHYLLSNNNNDIISVLHYFVKHEPFLKEKGLNGIIVLLNNSDHNIWYTYNDSEKICHLIDLIQYNDNKSIIDIFFYSFEHKKNIYLF